MARFKKNQQAQWPTPLVPEIWRQKQMDQLGLQSESRDNQVTQKDKVKKEEERENEKKIEEEEEEQVEEEEKTKNLGPQAGVRNKIDNPEKGKKRKQNKTK